MKRKKYAFGTKVNDHIENPNTALTENDIAIAKAMAEAANNPWTQGLDIAGQVGMQVASAMGGTGSAGGAVGGELGSFLTQNGQFLDDAMVMGSNMAKSFATGGTVPVEVEGNEVGETPNGQLLDFQGPTHEQGGINVSLPGGTDIYSDRISIDGKTMAERKKAREKKLAKLKKMFEKNPTDAILKKSLQRLEEANSIEEEKDMALQQAMKASNEKMAMGGKVDEGVNPNANYKNRRVDNYTTTVVGEDKVMQFENDSQEYNPDTTYITDGSKMSNEGKVNTMVDLKNDVHLDFDGTLEEHEDLIKRTNRANWSGAHGFRGKNWDAGMTEEEKKKFKEENPLWKKGRERHVEYDFSDGKAEKRTYYTQDGKKVVKQNSASFAEGGTVGVDPLEALQKKMKEAGITDVSEATPEMLQMMWDGITNKFEPSGEQSIPGSGNTVADNSFTEVKGKSEPAFKDTNEITNLNNTVPENKSTPEVKPLEDPGITKIDMGDRANATVKTNPDSTLANTTKSTTPIETPAENKILSDMDIFGLPNAVETLGLAGQLYSSVKPLQNTLNNRAGDTANINPYLNFGEDALQSIDAQKQFVAQQEARKLQDLELARNSALKRGRNSARSVNTQRALDLATEQSINNAKSQAYDASSTQMSRILGAEAQAKNQRDRMQMQGEQIRDMADRRDRDNFYTQLSKNQTNLGRGMQEMSKTLSQVANNERNLNMVNSKHPNYNMTKQGKIVDKNGNPLKGAELEKATEEMHAIANQEGLIENPITDEQVMAYLQANPDFKFK